MFFAKGVGVAEKLGADRRGLARVVAARRRQDAVSGGGEAAREELAKGAESDDADGELALGLEGGARAVLKVKGEGGVERGDAEGLAGGRREACCC